MDRQTNKAFVKLILEVFDPDNISAQFRYSPSCTRWTAQCSMPEPEIVQDMLTRFYTSLGQANYMMDPTLKSNLDATLPQYFTLGIRHQRQGFFHATHTLPLRYWMWGVPGIGKTEFIRVFAASMEQTIRAMLDPAFTVNVVKVPLNAMSCQTLNHILCIQGLSDWSVERMLEQSLARGHAVVMHLEEAPQDKALQDQLAACVERMLKKLFTRYPEYVSNVIMVFTSNHDPSVKLAKQSLVCAMEPPVTQQREWLVRKLQVRLGCRVEIQDEKAFPQVSKDIRPLNSWWMSVSYALLLQKGAVMAEDVAFVRSIAADGGGLEVGWNNNSEALQLHSSDGFFYTLQGKDKTCTIFDMCKQAFLTPAVIVLQGTVDALEQKEQALIKQWGDEEGGMTVRRVELTCQEDENKVLGDAGEVRGGLLRYIDDCTNPNSSTYKRARSDHVCAVFARVNEIGSFLLRELLEPGDKSRTHRLGVSKKRLLFVVSLDTETQLTPQLESRLHQHIHV